MMKEAKHKNQKQRQVITRTSPIGQDSMVRLFSPTLDSSLHRFFNRVLVQEIGLKLKRK